MAVDQEQTASDIVRPVRARRDLTAGSLGRHLATLALPAAVESMVFSAGDLVHALWLGRLGGTALAAVAVGTTLRIVLISPMMGLSVGGMALVARYVGAREQRLADRAAMQTVLLILAFCLPIALVGHLLARTWLGWMGATGSLLEEAAAFLRIILAGLFFMECLPTMTSVIRGAGHPEYTLRTNLVNVALLLLLDLLLVPSLGVRGAAVASVCASAGGVLAQFVILRSGKAGLRPRLADLRPEWAMLGRILRLSWPPSLQRLSVNLGSAVATRLITAYGADVLTAYSILMRLFTMLSGLSLGIANAVGPLVGQNLGALKPERARHAATLGTYAAIAAGVVLNGAVLLAPRFFLGLFTEDAQVLRAGLANVFLLAWVPILVNAWWAVVVMALMAAGEVIPPMLISIAYLWLVQIPLSWVLAQPLGLGPAGIWLGMIAGPLAGAIATTVRFRQGHWKRMVL